MGHPSEDLLVLSLNSANARAVHFVGGDQVAKFFSDWASLPQLALDNSNICDFNPELYNEMLLKSFPDVKQLQLRKNLLTNWEQVGQICSILPSLRTLDCSENRLNINLHGIKSENFKQVLSLAIHKMNYAWKNVVDIVEFFPNLKELGLSFNRINTISSATASCFHNITTLDLTGNHFNNWTEILKLGFMKKLTMLHLDECDIQTIEFSDVSGLEITSSFSSLRYLTIDFNKINDWISISELSKLGNLKELRIRHNPIYQNKEISRETARQLVIARLPRLRVLNGSEIFAEERRGAEIDFVTHLMDKFLEKSKNGNISEFQKHYPTFEFLLDKCNLRKDLTSEATLAPAVTNSAFIEVNFRMEKKPVVKQRVSSNVLIAKLKILAKRVLKLPGPPNALELSYQSRRVTLSFCNQNPYFFILRIRN